MRKSRSGVVSVYDDDYFFCHFSYRGPTCGGNNNLHSEGVGGGQWDKCETEVHLLFHSSSVTSVGRSVLELSPLKFSTGRVGVYKLACVSLAFHLHSLKSNLKLFAQLSVLPLDDFKSKCHVQPPMRLNHFKN